MLKNWLPQEYEFYDFFEKAARHAVDAAKILQQLTHHYNGAESLARQLDDLEHQCDEVAHVTLDRLNKTFITPLDREDIHTLILKVDDVVDLINAAANRLTFYKIGAPTARAKELADEIVRGCEKMAAAIHAMRSPKQYEAVMRECIGIHQVENAADDIFHHAMAELFEAEKDPIRVIKWKDIYETMELITDRCEDVANVLHGVIVKMT
jgi:predicted phosphate transport protein (TIGR00153 family)